MPLVPPYHPFGYLFPPEPALGASATYFLQVTYPPDPLPLGNGEGKRGLSSKEKAIPLKNSCLFNYLLPLDRYGDVCPVMRTNTLYRFLFQIFAITIFKIGFQELQQIWLFSSFLFSLYNIGEQENIRDVQNIFFGFHYCIDNTNFNDSSFHSGD